MVMIWTNCCVPSGSNLPPNENEILLWGPIMGLTLARVEPLSTNDARPFADHYQLIRRYVSTFSWQPFGQRISMFPLVSAPSSEISRRSLTDKYDVC